MSNSEKTIWDPISSLGRVMPPSDFVLDSPVVFRANEELTGKTFTTSLDTTNPNTYVKFIFLRTSPLNLAYRAAQMQSLTEIDGLYHIFAQLQFCPLFFVHRALPLSRVYMCFQCRALPGAKLLVICLDSKKDRQLRTYTRKESVDSCDQKTVCLHKTTTMTACAVAVMARMHFLGTKWSVWKQIVFFFIIIIDAHMLISLSLSLSFLSLSLSLFLFSLSLSLSLSLSHSMFQTSSSSSSCTSGGSIVLTTRVSTSSECLETTWPLHPKPPRKVGKHQPSPHQRRSKRKARQNK